MIFEKPSDIYGSASFMGFWAKRKLLKKSHDGLVIDGVRKIPLINSFTHCAVAAPSGRGKTSRFVIPNVLLRSKGQSMVITDPAGEVYHTCSDYLRSQGVLVKKLDMLNLGETDFYNPLQRANSHAEIRKLCTVLVTSQLGSQGGDPFWNESAISLLSIFIKCAKSLPSISQNLGEVYRMLNMLLSDENQITSLMKTQLDANTLTEYLGFTKQGKTLSSIVATAKAAIYSFGDPDIETLTSKDTIGIEELRERPTAIFLMVPDKDASSLMFLQTLLYSQLFDSCMQRGKSKNFLPIFLFLDEFGNLGKLPRFTETITTLRRWKVSVTILFQDVNQISKIYGNHDLSIILNGACSSRLILPGLSLETCAVIEKMLGNKTVVQRKLDPALWNLPSNKSEFKEVGRPLMTATEINQLKKNQLIFFHSNYKPALLKTTFWMDNKVLKRRGKKWVL